MLSEKKQVSVGHRRYMRQHVSAMALGVVIAATSGVAFGEAASTSDASKSDSGLFSNSLEEVIVTARKRQERLQDVPVSVTAFTATSLDSKSINNIIELSRFAPNVEINNGRADGGGSAISAYIRGVGQQDFIFPTDPGVGIYIDGVYMARTIGVPMDLSDVERVEILRGPQGTLYGKNTIGGAINVVSRKPILEGDPTGQIEGTVGRFNRTAVKGYVLAPIVEGKLGAKISVSSLHRDGFGERLTTGQKLGDEGKIIARGALRWAPSKDVDIELQADYQHQRQSGPVGTMVNRIPSDVSLPAFLDPFAPVGATSVRFDQLYNDVVVPGLNTQLGLPANSRYDSRWMTSNPYNSNGTALSRDNNDVWGLTLTADWNISDATHLKSITAYRHFSADIARDGDMTPYPVADTHNQQTEHQISQELQLSGTAVNDKLNWLVGAYYMDEHARDLDTVHLFGGLFEAYTPLFGAPGASTLSFDYLPLNEIKVKTWAFFTQESFKFTDQLSLTLGARYSKDKKEYYQDHQLLVVDAGTAAASGAYPSCNNTLPPNAPGRYVCPRTLSASWGSFTPKISIDYKPMPGYMIYAGYSKGFKGGGWSPRPTQQNNTDLAYGPEKLDQFEVGVKSEWLDRRLVVNLAGFYGIYQDVQTTTISSSGGGALLLLTRNLGKAEIYGLEGEVTARPARGLDLSASMGYLHSKWKSFNAANCNAGVFAVTNGVYCDTNLSLDDKLVDSPTWTINLGAQYAFSLDKNLGDLILRGDGSFKSKTWKDPYNLGRGTNYLGQPDIRTQPQAAGYLVTMPQLAQPDYWVFNLRLSWTNPSASWEVSTFVTNLFDKKYVTSVTPVDTFGYDEAYYGRPREWGVSTKYKF
jgi:iron complex outermembrane receptor protein